jgi:hypothetical protein
VAPLASFPWRARCGDERLVSVRRARIFLGHEVALVTVFFDDREAGFFPKHTVARVLVARRHHESPRVRPHHLVLLARELDDLGASLVFAFTEIGRPFLTQAELGRLLLEVLVRKSEGRLVLRGSLY